MSESASWGNRTQEENGLVPSQYPRLMLAIDRKRGTQLYQPVVKLWHRRLAGGSRGQKRRFLNAVFTFTTGC